jgi:DNA-binding MarR family transcriptional regulator
VLHWIGLPLLTLRKVNRSSVIEQVREKLKRSPAQLKALLFIDSYKRAHGGNPPPRSAIAEHLGTTPQNIDVLLMKLSRKGLITFDEFNRPMIPREGYISALDGE